MPKFMEYSDNAKELYYEIIKQLNIERRMKRMSYRQMQEASVNQQISYSILSRYFNGVNNMDMITFCELCAIIGVEPNAIIDRAKKAIQLKR